MDRRPAFSEVSGREHVPSCGRSHGRGAWRSVGRRRQRTAAGPLVRLVGEVLGGVGRRGGGGRLDLRALVPLVEAGDADPLRPGPDLVARPARPFQKFMVGGFCRDVGEREIQMVTFALLTRNGHPRHF